MPIGRIAAWKGTEQMRSFTLPSGESLDLTNKKAVRRFALEQIAKAAAGQAPGMNVGALVTAAKELLAYADSMPDRQESVFRDKPDSVEDLNEARERLRQAKIAERRGK